MLEKTRQSPLDCKEIQPALGFLKEISSGISEGDQFWDFFGRNDSKAETPVLWPPHANEISSGISLEGMILKLKLQYFGHLMRRVDSLEKTLMLGGIGGKTRRGRQRMRWLDGITDSMDMSLSEPRSW